jgi:CheY-like chemotaxis protein
MSEIEIAMVGTERTADADQFTVLVVEDTDGTRSDIADRLREIDDVVVLEAATKDEAVAKIAAHHIDAATVDIELQGMSAGFDVLAHLGQRSPRAGVVIVTQYARGHQGEILMNYIGKQRPSIISVLDKNKVSPADAAIPIEDVVESWRESAVTLENADLLLHLLEERGKHRKEFKGKLREAPDELMIELERACRDLFGGIQRIAGGAEPKVTFEPIARQGFSSAFTVKASVGLGTDAAGEPVDGSKCVVKVGPTSVIQEEVDRYNQFVKYGVRLAERVELLAQTSRDGFAAIVYSFAGGVFGEELLTLDELFTIENGHVLAGEAIELLFRRSENNWYSVTCRREPPTKFLDGGRFDESYHALHKELRNLHGQFPTHGYGLIEAMDDRDGAFTFPGGKLTIPTTRIAGGHDLISPSRPQCFVHGDMHGGNVMVELSNVDGDTEAWRLRRVCLIDYRRAGAGPRAIDAVALQASLRLADARGISAAAAEPGEDEPRDEALAAAADQAARRSFVEAELLASVWNQTPPDEVVAGREDASWEASALLIARLMRLNFPDMKLEEYLAIAVPCGVRQLRFSLGPVGRVRMLAWVSAMWEAADGQAGSPLQEA